MFIIDLVRVMLYLLSFLIILEHTVSHRRYPDIVVSILHNIICIAQAKFGHIDKFHRFLITLINPPGIP